MQKVTVVIQLGFFDGGDQSWLKYKVMISKSTFKIWFQKHLKIFRPRIDLLKKRNIVQKRNLILL